MHIASDSPPPPPFSLPSSGGKRITAAFDRGKISSGGGVPLLTAAIDPIDTLVALIPDHRDPAFKLACGRLSENSEDPASQPTMPRWRNAPDRHTLVRLSHTMADLWCSRRRHAPGVGHGMTSRP